MAVQFITVRVDTTVINSMSEAGEEAFVRAGASSINRLIRSIRAKVIRDVATNRQVKPQGVYGRRVKMHRAIARRLIGSVESLLRPIPISRMSGLRDTRKKTFDPEGKGAGAGGRWYPKAFVAKGLGGHTMIFERETQSRRPVEVKKQTVEDIVEISMIARLHEAEGQLADMIEREVAWRMDGGRGTLGKWAY